MSCDLCDQSPCDRTTLCRRGIYYKNGRVMIELQPETLEMIERALFRALEMEV